MSINKATAERLRDGLIEARSLSDFHSLPSYESACKVVHGAGLGTALIPLATPSARHKRARWGIHLAVVDPHASGELCLGDLDGPLDDVRVYSLTQLIPMTDYVGDLASCNLHKPWWAAPSFFCDISKALAPWECDHHSGSRSQWGHAMRNAFSESFEKVWQDSSRILKPNVVIDPKKLRFQSAPITLAPAPAGNDQ